MKAPAQLTAPAEASASAEALSAWACQLLGCQVATISKPHDRYFLIMEKGGELSTIACGHDLRELADDVLFFHSLGNYTMDELLAGAHPEVSTRLFDFTRYSR